MSSQGGWGSGLVYLAGPLPCDAVEADERKDWREVVIGDASGGLAYMGFSAYSPPHALTVAKLTPAVARAVIAINDAALDQAIAVIANVGGPSFGTPIEAWRVKEAGRPVFCFGGHERSVYQWSFDCWERSYGLALNCFVEWARAGS